MPEQLEPRARLHPDKTAVTAGGVSLSFRELAERSNRIANALIDLGVGRDITSASHGQMRGRLRPARGHTQVRRSLPSSTEPASPGRERIAFIFENLGPAASSPPRALRKRQALLDGLGCRAYTEEL